jgi:hypothetical protein
MVYRECALAAINQKKQTLRSQTAVLHGSHVRNMGRVHFGHTGFQTHDGRISSQSHEQQS